MKLNAIAFALIAAATVGCDQSEPAQIDPKKLEMPQACTANAAKVAAGEVIAPIMQRIADPLTRSQGCDDFDNYLRQSSEVWAERERQDCWWGQGENDPEAVIDAFARQHQMALSRLCRWREKDFEASGRAILESMSPEDRRIVEDAYNGI